MFDPANHHMDLYCFFARQKGEFRGVIDYRALDLITKRNNAPIPRIDEMMAHRTIENIYENGP